MAIVSDQFYMLYDPKKRAIPKTANLI